MRFNYSSLVAIGALLIASTGFAAAPSSSATVSDADAALTESVAAAPTSNLIGSIDIRPTLSTDGHDTAGIENEIVLGYKVTPNTQFSYTQAFTTNLSNHGDTGLNLLADTGWFKGKFKNVWVSEDEDDSATYEFRVYTPTQGKARDAGLISGLRNSISLKKKLGATTSVSMYYVPVFWFYNKPGANNEANKWFDHRVYLVADWDITDKLAFSFPLLMSQSRYRNFAKGAKNNNKWTYDAIIYPEVTYSLNDNVSLGLALRSGVLFESDLSNFSIGNAIKDSATQLVLNVSL